MHLPRIDAEITTALLDVDGTLLDSNDAHARAWVDALLENGLKVPYGRVRPLIGMGADQMLPEIATGLSDEHEPGKSIARRHDEIFMSRYLPALAPTPGARELVELLATAGVTCVVATSAKKAQLDALLVRADVADLIHATATSADAEASKPAPDI